MKELVAGVGVLAICLIGSMETAHPINDLQESAWCSAEGANAGHGMAMPSMGEAMRLPMARDLDCIDLNVPVDTVISNDVEARSICRSACGIAGGWWNGSWQTAVGGNLSFCGCRICQPAN